MSTDRALGHVAEILAARTGHHLDTARTRLYDYVRDIGLVPSPVGASTVRGDVADALLQAHIPGLTTTNAAGAIVAHPGGDYWRYTLAVLCGFGPSGRPCPNLATVVVTLTGLNLPDDLVPTCDDCLPCWNDHVQATAAPITAPITAPATAPATAGTAVGGA